ncbi:shikimate kinase [Membranihabitans maritimus]|uniref:shikimate kinase n=1 Tax=Membranihabitans maritimus TaxID=2904244 RepID=UPI001F401EE6|nr:shikimate kinase [Membranihabitans maritimus]
MNKAPIVFLIGFMGSGKTHLAKHVSGILTGKVIEMDSEIEKKYGAKIKDIFSEKGESYFRELEREVLYEIIATNIHSTAPVLISTGGGTPCFYDNMEVMSGAGTTLYLRPSNIVLLRRLEKEKEERPLIRNKTRDEILEYIKQKVNEREKYYLKADIVFNPVNPDIGNLAQLVKEIIYSSFPYFG